MIFNRISVAWFPAAAWLLVLPSVLTAQPATIQEPPAVVAPGEDVDLYVGGIKRDDLPKAKMVYYPRAGVRCKARYDWGLFPVIEFRAKTAGSYLIGVGTVGADGQVEWSEVIIHVGTPEPDPDPTPNPYRPDPRYQPITDRVEMNLPTAAKRKMAAMFSSLGSQAVAGAIKTTVQLRDSMTREGKSLGLKGTDPTAPAQMELAFRSLFYPTIPAGPMPDKPLTADAPAKLETLAFSLFGGGE